MPILTCPQCSQGMQEIQRNQVLIDICPQCRGVWLDRGELEKMLETGRKYEREYEREREHYYKDSGKPYRKRKHWLMDFFD